MATAWQNIPATLSLRDEFNRIAPGRATGADGTVGDLAHQERSSDHNPDETGAVPIRDADKVNEVHALDITTDLRTPGLTWTGPTWSNGQAWPQTYAGMEAVVQFLLARCRSGAEKRLRYIIFNRRIWEASNGWRQRAYTLADPHVGHAHFSFSYDSKREADASPWHLEDIPMALTSGDKKWIEGVVEKTVAKYVGDVTPRWTDEGGRVPASDPNPKMLTADGVHYAGATAKRVENLAVEIKALLTKATPPAKA